MLADQYRSEIETILSQSPAGQPRAALMALLYLVQKAYGYIALEGLTEVGDLLGLNPAEVASLAGFYTLYRLHPGGRRRVQVCTDLPCALRGAEQFADALCAQLHIRLGETTADGEFTVEAVTCLAGCQNPPVFQVQTADGVHYYAGPPEQPLTAAGALDILNSLKNC